MGLDLTIYELKNYDPNNVQKKFDIETVMYLSNDTAMLLVNWLYRNDEAKLTANYLKLNSIYHEIYGYKFKEVLENLKTVLNASVEKKDTLALFYFPCLYTVGDWISNVEMFSEYYYNDLEYLHEQLGKLLKGDNAKHPDKRLFLYNITW